MKCTLIASSGTAMRCVKSIIGSAFQRAAIVAEIWYGLFILTRKTRQAMDRFVFSSRPLPPDQSIAATRHVYESLAQIELDPIGDDFFSDISVLQLPDVAIARILSSACVARRTAAHIADGNDDLIFQLVTVGRCLSRQKGGREMHLLAGDAYLAPNDCAGESVYDQGAHGFSISIPRAVLADRVPAHSIGRMRKLVSSAELRLFTQYALSLSRETTRLEPMTARLAATHLQDLAVLVLGTDRDNATMASRRGLRAVRYKAISADIAANIDNPALSLDWIARRHGVSPRYLRALFYDEHTSFTDFVLNARLERAHQMLTDPAMRGHRISAIAFNAGFSDLSWFNEAFRRRYAMTPSDARAIAATNR